jgi:uncharacterized membrane protein YgdD (TMEM256/DUF423 family)
MTAASSSRWILAAAGLLLAIATLLGALAAHALPARLSASDLYVFDTGVRYHFYNALGLLAIGLTARDVDSRLVRWAGGLVIAGVALFSGSLYWLTFGAPRVVGFLTPVGGIAFTVAWLLFAAGVLRG